MTTAVQRRRGTTSQHSTFTGLEGEITVDTTKDTIVVHDGSTAGGIPILREDFTNGIVSGLGSINGADTANDDQFLIFDTSTSTFKKISRAELNNAIEQDPIASATISGNLTLSGGTANGVLYLNASKVVTSGSAFTFDGTTLATTGNVTLGDASTDTVLVNGVLGVGASAGTNRSIYSRPNATLSGTSQNSVEAYITGSLTATSNIRGFIATPETQAASFTCANVIGFDAQPAIKGAGSTITNAVGLYLRDQTQGTNNYGILSIVSSGANKWNIYASGTAANHFAGDIRVGTTTQAGSSQLTAYGATNGQIAVQNSTNWSRLLQNANDLYIDNGTGGSAGNIVFRSGSGTTERMRLDSSGNLLLGTTASSGQQQLQVQFASSNSSAGVRIRNTSSGGTTSNASFQLGNDSSEAAGALFQGASNYTPAGGANSLNLYNFLNAPLVFGTNNTERMRLDSSGNVGIGTSSPATRLQIGSSTVDATAKITLGKTAATTEALLPTIYAGSVIAAGMGVDAVIESSSTSGGIVFRTGNTPVTRAALDSSGNLGIGTASPTFKLQVSADSSAGVGGQINLRNGAARAVGNAARISFQPNNDYTSTVIGAYIQGVDTSGTPANSCAIVFGTGSGGVPAERMRLDSSGNLGLGVTPSAWASLAGSAFQNGGNGALWSRGVDEFWVSQNVYNDGSSRYVQTRAASAYQQSSGSHVWYNAPSGTAGNAITFTQAMTLNASGNLGLGVTPSAWFASSKVIQVGTGASISSRSNTIVEITSNAFINTSGSWTYQNTGEATLYAGAGGLHRWSIAPSGTAGTAITFTEAMTLDASGNLGVGTTTPVNKLQIVGSFGRGAPVTKTGNFTLAATENWIICNGTGTITVTLPAASSWTGREFTIKTIAAFTVISNASNVVPLAGGAAGTAILAATAGTWATLVSDGTNWIIMQA